MSTDEKIAMVKAMSGESEDIVVSVYLYLTGQKILRMVCADDVTEVPEKYDALHVEATVYFLNKRGAEGQLSHGENGISRSYETGDIPASMLLSYGVCGRAEAIS